MNLRRKVLAVGMTVCVVATAWAATPPGARALVNDGAGRWTLTTQVGAGRQLYKLVIDGNRWVRDPAARLRYDAFKLRLPLVGRITRGNNAARFART